MLLDDYLTRNYGFEKSVKDNWNRYTRLWKSWYQGKVKSFHNYSIYNGRKTVRMERASLQMAKKCCEDWADLLFNERCKISLTNDTSQEQLDNILTQNDFWRLINESIERSGASGTGAIVTSVLDIGYNEGSNIIDVSSARTRLEYVDVDQIYPISFEGNKITECAFCVEKHIKGKTYEFVSVHLLRNGNYIIENKAFLNENGSLRETDDIQNAFSVFDTKLDIPWFSILTPGINNNILPSLPWGIPYFANAIDALKAIDIGFDSFVNEISLSRKRIFIREEMTTLDFSSGEQKAVFDNNDLAVYCLPKGLNAADLFQSESSNIRSDSLISYMRSMLSSFSSLVGFGRDKYDFDSVNMTTATQVISANSDMFRRKKKHEIKLESALFDIIKSVAYASTTFGPYNINTDGLVIQFDDSIIEDTEAIADRAMREQSAGLISPVEYRTNVKGETEDVAEAKIKKIKDEYPTMNQLIGEGNAK